MKSIISGGGPLVCIELEVSDSWLGINGNSIQQELDLNASSDYEIACSIRDYIGKLSIRDRDVLILGDMPLETLIWIPSNGLPMIVRIYYGDPDVDIIKLLQAAENLNFNDPVEILLTEIKSSPIVVFDSAYPGFDTNVDKLSFELPPGKYRILTKQFYPDERTSVLIHLFVRAQS